MLAAVKRENHPGRPRKDSWIDDMGLGKGTTATSFGGALLRIVLRWFGIK
jgi:hypothetical protein